MDKREHRDNRPLWAALALLALLIVAFALGRWNRDTLVIWPLYRFSYSLLEVGVVSILVLLMLIGWLRRRVGAFLTALALIPIMLMSCVMWLNAGVSRGVNTAHINVDGTHYRLAVVETYELDFPGYKTTVTAFQCERFGWVCAITRTYRHGASTRAASDINARLHYDPQHDQVIAEVDGRHTVVLADATDADPLPHTLAADSPPISAENVASLAEVAVVHYGDAGEVAFSPDGTLLAIGTDGAWWGSEPDEVLLVDFSTGSAEASLQALRYFREVIWHPDGESMAVLDGNHLFLNEAGSDLRTILAEDVDPGVAFSPDGTRIAYAQHGVIVRELATGDETILDVEGANINAMAFSGERLAAAGYGLHVWDDGERLDLLDHERVSPFFDVAFSADADRIFAAGSFGVQAIDLATDTTVWQHAENPAFPRHVALSADGSAVLAGYSDGRIVALDSENGVVLLELDAHASDIHSLSLAPDGSLLASASADGTVRLWGSVQP